MGRKKLKGVRPRTLNLDIDSYEAVLHFWKRSNTGVSGTTVIRELIRSYGQLCKQRIIDENYSSTEDVSNLSEFAREFVARENEVTR